MKKNVVLEALILAFVLENPGFMRRQIARRLQKTGVNLGQQHISNRIGELVARGKLSERVTEDGQRLIFPRVSDEVTA